MKKKETMKNQSNNTTGRAFAGRGIPEIIVTDNGPEFLSSTDMRLTIENGVKSKLNRPRKSLQRD